MQNEEAQEEVETVLHKESTEITAMTDKTMMEEYDERMLYKEEEVQNTLVKRDLEETVMDREIKNVLEGELFLTESKVSMSVENNHKEEEDAKVLFEEVEELLEHASWQNLIHHCIQNLY